MGLLLCHICHHCGWGAPIQSVGTCRLTCAWWCTKRSSLGSVGGGLTYNEWLQSNCLLHTRLCNKQWSRNLSASWAERFRTSSLLCTYKLCDYYSPIPILSPFLFTPSLYVTILNLQDFSFTYIHIIVAVTTCEYLWYLLFCLLQMQMMISDLFTSHAARCKVCGCKLH